MRQASLENLSSYDKHHLSRLPNIDKNEVIEGYDYNDNFLVLLCIGGDRGMLSDHLVKSACWGRRSWLLFSDAIKMGVQIGFIVEASVLKHVIPILKANGIDTDKDVFSFENTWINNRTYHNKKFLFLDNEYFDKYEHVFISDTDLFLASQSGMRCDFFGNYGSPEGIGAMVWDSLNSQFCMMPNPDRQLNEHLDYRHDYDQIEYFRQIKEYWGNYVFSKYKEGILPRPAAYLHAYDMKLVDTYRERLLPGAKCLPCNDEVLLAYWVMDGKPAYSIESHTGIKSVTHLHEIDSVRNEHDPYFIHAANFIAEYYWRLDTNSL